MEGSGNGKVGLRVEQVKRGVTSHVVTMPYTTGPLSSANSDHHVLVQGKTALKTIL